MKLETTRQHRLASVMNDLAFLSRVLSNDRHSKLPDVTINDHACLSNKIIAPFLKRQ